MDVGLAGRVYLVSGGTRGLGRAGAAALLAEGAAVVLSGRDGARAAAAAAELGPRAAGVAGDLADPATPGRLLAAAAQRFGRVDGALVSVGGPPAVAALAAGDEQWRAAFESVFLGAVRLAREVVAALGAGGAVGLVLSTSVYTPMPGLALSNGLRPGLAMVAKTMADEAGPRGIRVFGLAPGRIATERITELDSLAGDPVAARRQAEADIPLRRYGEPAEFGALAAFLLSPAASYLTGCVVTIDGGATRAV